ncbi:hypothetical protein MNBD_NITROSPINAE02-1664 [hydrothermal vent metagenome]|uniref:histidine kinase n=1 Tax=hydrothermal vent metagenome TaxID=652676 RepID=A0A3B1C758_9ZZZZ
MSKFQNFLVVIVLVIFVGGIAIVFYFSDMNREANLSKAVEVKNVSITKVSIDHYFRMIVTDLLFLTDTLESELGSEDDVEHSLQKMAGYFRSMSLRKGIYDQIRLINEEGREVIRINYNNGKPEIAGKEKLQQKGNRYYFRDTFRLKRGDVYVSPLDLNIEGGKIEVPFKPVIRFGMPVFDADGKKHGIVVVNFLAFALLDQIKKLASNSLGDIMLLNAHGYWFIGPKPEDEWGFMFPDRKEISFANTYKDEWSIMRAQDSGQINTNSGLFTFKTAFPLLADWKTSTGSAEAFAPSKKQSPPEAYYWKIVSHVRPEALSAGSRELFARLATLYAALVLALGLSAWLVDRTFGKSIGMPAGGGLSPFVLISATATVIFISEVMVMLILPFFQPLSKMTEAFVNASFMTIMVVPTLYFLLYRPLNHHIVKRAIAENELREKSDIIDSMLTSSVDMAIAATDLDFRITYYNPMAEKIFGYAAKEVIGRTVMQMHTKENVEPERFEKAIEIVAQKGEYRYSVEKEKDGEKRYIDSRVSGIYDKENNMFGYMLMSRDVTDKRISEKQKEEFITELDRANTELKDFAYIVSHDLKAPLRAISSLAGWMSQDYSDKLDDEGREHLQLLVSRAKRMNNLIDGILKYSRIGRVKPQMEKIDSLAVVKNVVDSVDPPDNIVVKIVKPLPTIVYDQTHLAQVFQNLIGNAITHLGKPEGEIIVACDDEAEKWRFSVKDNGIGIDEKYFERIFKIFQSLKARDELETTGIGLSIVKKIVETNGGAVTIKSKVGAGSEFIFTIPKQIDVDAQ